MTEVESAPPWVEVTCQSAPEFPQMVCGPASAEFHSLLYRSYPSEVFLVPSGALLHHAQLPGLGGGAADDELALGDGRGARLGEDCGAEDEVLGLGNGLGAEVPRGCVDVKVPSNSSSATVPGACPTVEVPGDGPSVEVPGDGRGVEVPGDGSGVAVVTPRHPTASRATSTSTAIFGDVIAGQAIAGWAGGPRFTQMNAWFIRCAATETKPSCHRCRDAGVPGCRGAARREAGAGRETSPA